jgi:hypothetical protein
MEKRLWAVDRLTKALFYSFFSATEKKRLHTPSGKYRGSGSREIISLARVWARGAPSVTANFQKAA